MAERQFRRLSFRCRVAVIISGVLILSAELIMHRSLANEYYYLKLETLRLTAATAARVGAQYLPADPHAALREADKYAEGHGIAPAEIIFTQLSAHNTVLTIRLDRKIPIYVTVLAVGGLPSRDIDVTASARRQAAGPDVSTRILDVLTNRRGTSERRVLSHAARQRQRPTPIDGIRACQCSRRRYSDLG